MTHKPTLKEIPVTRIQFPEIRLKTRDAHKLRGYFGNLFKEHSPLLHNHYEDGRLRYQYPQIQYKVIRNIPTLIGLGEGGHLLPQLFLKIKHLDIDGQHYEVTTKNIEHKNIETGYSLHLQEYEFSTLWMALNQQNYEKYQKLPDQEARTAMLNSILTGHILGFLRSTQIELQDHERIMVKVAIQQKSTLFKEQKMVAFTGTFIANVLLPDSIGLGKSVSRGFGTIKKI